jgi:hypothetical protein
MAKKDLSSAFRTANPISDPNRKEIFRQTVYDRINLSSSLTGTYTPFSVAKGTTVSLIRGGSVTSAAKTIRDTNLPQPGADNNRDYLLSGISMALMPVSYAAATSTTSAIRVDKNQIREGGVMNFKIGDKQIIDLPLWMIPELNAEGSVSTTGSGLTILGGPSYASQFFMFGEDIPLMRSEVITMTLTWDGTITLSQSFDLAIVFAASLRRNS